MENDRCSIRKVSSTGLLALSGTSKLIVDNRVGFVGNIQTLTLLSHIAQGESKTFELQLQLKTASSGGYEVFNDAPLVRFIHNWDPSGKIECQLLVRKPFEGENDIPYSFPLPGIEEKGFLILVYKGTRPFSSLQSNRPLMHVFSGPQYVNNKDLTPQDLESVKRAVEKISNLVWKCER